MSNSTLNARTAEETTAERTDFSPCVQAALLEFAEEIAELAVTIKPLPAHLFERGWWGAYDHAERSIYLCPSLGPSKRVRLFATNSHTPSMDTSGM